jgi:hypothetical protein
MSVGGLCFSTLDPRKWHGRYHSRTPTRHRIDTDTDAFQSSINQHGSGIDTILVSHTLEDDLPPKVNREVRRFVF